MATVAMKLKDAYSLEESTNRDSVLKSRDITLLTKICIVKAIIFPVVMYGCESWTIKKAERRRIDASELWCWRRLFAGSQREELHPWQRSWGRRLWHMQRWDRGSGNPLFPSIYPQNQSLPTLLFHALTYTSDFTGVWPPLPLLEKELTYSSK